MNPNPENYANLKASKRLVEAGIVLETDLVWSERIFHGDFVLVPKGAYHRENCTKWYPAPSMAEVWRELPDFLDVGTKRYRKTLYADGGHSIAWYGGLERIHNSNPTNALIDLLIWVRQRKEK